LRISRPAAFLEHDQSTPVCSGMHGNCRLWRSVNRPVDRNADVEQTSLEPHTLQRLPRCAIIGDETHWCMPRRATDHLLSTPLAPSLTQTSTTPPCGTHFGPIRRQTSIQHAWAFQDIRQWDRIFNHSPAANPASQTSSMVNTSHSVQPLSVQDGEHGSPRQPTAQHGGASVPPSQLQPASVRTRNRNPTDRTWQRVNTAWETHLGIIARIAFAHDSRIQLKATHGLTTALQALA